MSENNNYNSANEDDVKRAQKQEELDKTGEAKDFKAIMTTPEGRRFIWRLLSRCGMYQTSFTGNSKTFFLEGQRNVGLHYMALMNEHCLEEYTLMVKENQAREE